MSFTGQTLEEQVRRADARRLTVMLDEERRSRVTLKCECGVRLDRLGIIGGAFTIGDWKLGRERDLRDRIAGRLRPEPTARPLRNVERRQVVPDKFGVVNYDCGKCGRHYSKKVAGLVAAARRRLTAGGRELVLGIDV